MERVAHFRHANLNICGRKPLNSSMYVLYSDISLLNFGRRGFKYVVPQLMGQHDCFQRILDKFEVIAQFAKQLTLSLAMSLVVSTSSPLEYLGKIGLSVPPECAIRS